MKRLLALAAIAATGSILIGVAPASAIDCPDGTKATPVADTGKNICLPEVHCDPAACW